MSYEIGRQSCVNAFLPRFRQDPGKISGAEGPHQMRAPEAITHSALPKKQKKVHRSGAYVNGPCAHCHLVDHLMEVDATRVLFPFTTTSRSLALPSPLLPSFPTKYLFGPSGPGGLGPGFLYYYPTTPLHLCHRDLCASSILIFHLNHNETRLLERLKGKRTSAGSCTLR